ncbi:Vascular endothelial growth factor C, partial [Anabarilius grahami]
RSAGSVDELMRIVYPSYWSMLKCRSKAGSRLPHREYSSTETRSEEASFAAAFINLDIIKSIETEWRKTLCMPRQVCLDVGKEFGAATNTFYKPPCVSVYRCGGCCNSEEHQCVNISTSYISKTLFEITVPIKQGTKPVTISFANHTSCSCLSKLDVYRQRHSIIRRALPENVLSYATEHMVIENTLRTLYMCSLPLNHFRASRQFALFHGSDIQQPVSLFRKPTSEPGFLLDKSETKSAWGPDITPEPLKLTKTERRERVFKGRGGREGDVMWQIKHAQKITAGVIAYADVCRCLTPFFQNHILRVVMTELLLFLFSPSADIEQDFCGPDKELDEETCQCVCRKELRTASCGPLRYLDKNSCQCACKAQPSSCGPQQNFNKDTCQCTCAKVCPRSHPLNRTKCVCECTESPNKCFLKGRRFQPATCR